MMTWVRLLTKDMPRILGLVLAVTLITWLWYGFKKVEPYIFPVVEEIRIDAIEHLGTSVQIRGSLDKVRSCEFIELIAYSKGYLVDIGFTETLEPVNRLPGEQYFGWWVFTPDVNFITIYSRHYCGTGTVLTKLYEGKI